MEGGTPTCTLEDVDPSAAGLFTTWSEEMCLGPSPYTPGAFVDDDLDGVHDYCEAAAAAAFAPTLIFSSHDCSWDNGLGRMGGEYFYAVESKLKTNPSTQEQYQVLRVAYLPAYYWDCGNASSVPLASWFDPVHSGDSELILVDASYDSTSHHWVTDAVFLSAHCGTMFDQFCVWYPPSGVHSWVDARSLGAAYIWVSRNKHANYMTEGQCDTAIVVGGIPLEDCEFDTPMRFPVSYVQQNIGSRVAPFRNCDPPFSSSSMVSPSETECMWSYHPNATTGPLGRFNGWQVPETGPRATPYGTLLASHAGL